MVFVFLCLNAKFTHAFLTYKLIFETYNFSDVFFIPGKSIYGYFIFHYFTLFFIPGKSIYGYFNLAKCIYQLNTQLVKVW